jgi:hypothetical protein
MIWDSGSFGFFVLKIWNSEFTSFMLLQVNKNSCLLNWAQCWWYTDFVANGKVFHGSRSLNSDGHRPTNVHWFAISTNEEMNTRSHELTLHTESYSSSVWSAIALQIAKYQNRSIQFQKHQRAFKDFSNSLIVLGASQMIDGIQINDIHSVIVQTDNSSFINHHLLYHPFQDDRSEKKMRRNGVSFFQAFQVVDVQFWIIIIAWEYSDVLGVSAANNRIQPWFRAYVT